MTARVPTDSSTLAIDGSPSDAVRDLEREADEVIGLGTHLGATIDWAVRVGAAIPHPGGGRTLERWSALAAAAGRDVGAARVLEPHVDALAILDEARQQGELDPGALDSLEATSESAWGVYAAEGPERLEATRDDDGRWRLKGVKSWCSLATELSHALVTAWVSPDARRLFAVSLTRPEVEKHRGPWVSRGLSRIVSAPVEFHDAPAVAVGGDDWYLRRPGFAWGGIGVAAVWWGGAVPLLDALLAAASGPRRDQLAETLLGEADAASWSVRAALIDAARRIDAEPDASAKLLAERVRAIAAAAVERIVTISGHALGPGPLTSDEEFARRVSDLRIYLRQHHAERDLARLGRALAAT